jgi:hypothetical protein
LIWIRKDIGMMSMSVLAQYVASDC